jgi:hypothetical protein
MVIDDLVAFDNTESYTTEDCRLKNWIANKVVLRRTQNAMAKTAHSIAVQPRDQYH